MQYYLLLWSVHQRLLSLLGVLSSLFKTSIELRLENLALRHQLGVLRRSAPKRLKLKLRPADRILWVWLRRIWTDWKSALLIVKECIKKRVLRPPAVERKDGIRDTIFGRSLPIGRQAPVCVSAIAGGCPSLSIAFVDAWQTAY
jgi:hypothetical protein